MTALIIIGAIVLVVVLINLIAVGVDASYADGEAGLSAKICGFHVQVYPRPPEKQKKPPKKQEEEKKEAEPGGETPESKLGSLIPSDLSKEEILELLKVAMRTASRFRRKLCIDRIKLWFVSSDPDPYITIMVYNYVNDAVCALGAIAENSFRVKHSDIRIASDFNVGRPFLEAGLAMSIRIGQIAAIAISAAIAGLKILYRHKKQQKKMLKEQLAA